MDRGQYMFVVVVPPHFESDCAPAAVGFRTSTHGHAGGVGPITSGISNQTISTISRTDADASQPVHRGSQDVQPNGVSSWFTSVVAIINQLTLRTTVRLGRGDLRARARYAEHLPDAARCLRDRDGEGVGPTVCHLVAVALSLFLVVQGLLQVPFAGSVLLWLFGVVLYLFFATALGLYLGTISRSMAQFALLIILVVMVLQLLSGGTTPVESQPQWLQAITYFLPSRHFVSFSQVIIYRGGGLSAVWRQFLMVGLIGTAFFVYSISLFRKSIAVTK
jgi:ABC-2 type transport system permease protein